jgi:hypothetical protein
MCKRGTNGWDLGWIFRLSFPKESEIVLKRTEQRFDVFLPLGKAFLGVIACNAVASWKKKNKIDISKNSGFATVLFL